jgi:hypothetical protein
MADSGQTRCYPADKSLGALEVEGNPTKSYSRRILRLALLAPDIVAGISREGRTSR